MPWEDTFHLDTSLGPRLGLQLSLRKSVKGLQIQWCDPDFVLTNMCGIAVCMRNVCLLPMCESVFPSGAYCMQERMHSSETRECVYVCVRV